MGDNLGQCHSVDMYLLKISSLLGVFIGLPLPEIPSTYFKALMLLISSGTYGPHKPPDTWVVSLDPMYVY